MHFVRQGERRLVTADWNLTYILHQGFDWLLASFKRLSECELALSVVLWSTSAAGAPLLLFDFGKANIYLFVGMTCCNSRPSRLQLHVRQRQRVENISQNRNIYSCIHIKTGLSKKNQPSKWLFRSLLTMAFCTTLMSSLLQNSLPCWPCQDEKHAGNRRWTGSLPLSSKSRQPCSHAFWPK